ncbi:MAG: TonB-dependent receptor plug domain-containing protein [Saprospiraceae bacterium]|nr:TonB-dependent receptor plug domain-containing protein [Saprospiraceae bacterium]
MKALNLQFFLFLLLPLFILQIACSSSKGVAGDKRAEKVYTSLLDRLRDQPELTISGSETDPVIRIRGNTSLTSDNEPLFVVNGNPVGSGFTSVSYSLDVNNVESIRVLTRSQAGLYGSRGVNGVIIIKTK